MQDIQISETVMFYDTDCGGVVSNIAYLRFVEKARTALFQTLGMSPKVMSESQLFPTVIRTEIDYRKPAKLGDEVQVFASLEKVENVRAECAFSLEVKRDAGPGMVVAEARQTVALVQMPSGRPLRMPSEWRIQR